MKRTCTQIRNILLASVLIISLDNQIYAQATDFEMDDYLYRTPGFNALGLRVGSNSSFTTGQKLFSFGFTPSTTYNRQFSSDRVQFNFWNWTDFAVSKQPNSAPPVPIPGIPVMKNPWLVNIASRIDWTQRVYSDNKFFEIGSQSNIGTGNGYNTQQRKANYTVALNPTVGVGMGRLEYVSNAQMALFILNDLKEAGKITGTVSKEMAYQFTELVTKLYNTRVFDFRKRRNYEVGQIDSFLVENKMITGNDIVVYNIIADNWNYAIQPSALESTYFLSGSLLVNNPNSLSDRINQFGVFNQPSRFAGTRTSLLLTIPSAITNMPVQGPGSFMLPGMFGVPGYNPGAFGFNTDSSVKNVIQTTKGYNFALKWESHAVMSLEKQNILALVASIGNNILTWNTVFKDNKPDSLNTNKTFSYGLTASFNQGCFPNSRTVVSWHSYVFYGNSVVRQNQVKQQSGATLVLSSMINLNYFLNLRSRVSANAGLSYSPVTPFTGSKNLNLNFNITYVNYLF